MKYKVRLLAEVELDVPNGTDLNTLDLFEVEVSRLNPETGLDEVFRDLEVNYTQLVGLERLD